MDYNNISDLYTSIDLEKIKSFDSSNFVFLNLELSGKPEIQSEEITAFVSYIKEQI